MTRPCRLVDCPTECLSWNEGTCYPGFGQNSFPSDPVGSYLPNRPFTGKSVQLGQCHSQSLFLDYMNTYKVGLIQETEVVTAGFPCVDVSRAGKRLGLNGQVITTRASRNEAHQAP